MSRRFAHVCLRVLDIDAACRFYALLGFEPRGRLNFATAYNVYLGLPDGEDLLELTVNVGRTALYDGGEAFNHLALTVGDLDAALAALAAEGIAPEKPAYRPGERDDLPRIAFVVDPDGYRWELIEGTAFRTPQDPAPQD